MSSRANVCFSDATSGNGLERSWQQWNLLSPQITERCFWDNRERYQTGLNCVDSGRKSAHIGNQIGIGLDHICIIRPDLIAITGV
jgi:hypothetical protein